MKLVILGRDGILNVYREDHVKAPDEWRPVEGALEALSHLNHAGWHAVVATNQAGIGRGMIDMASVNAVHQRMIELAQARGARIDAVFFCPHTPEEQCDCRKPLPGMLLDIGRRYGVDLRHVPVVSDTLRDMHAAQAAGCEPHLVRTGRAADLSAQALQAAREQIPGLRDHADLAACFEHLVRREADPPPRAVGLDRGRAAAAGASA
jgi:D-glycero-D-manno-heptose 1,7-bisphosphate phosphatase